MLIDWFTVGAQVLNFVILVALLKRFLYRPVLDAIDAREQRIARQIADARALHESAARERDEYQRRQSELDGERGALLKQAALDAEAERGRLLDAARVAADAVSTRRHDAERDAAAHLRRSIADRTSAEVFAIARKTLADLADTTLEERLVGVLVRRLAALDIAARHDWMSGLDPRAPQVTVRSAFEFSPTQRKTIEAAVGDLCPRGVDAAAPLDVVYEISPELVAGVELVAGGRSLGWNIAAYMDSLEHVFDEMSASPSGRTAPAAANAEKVIA